MPLQSEYVCTERENTQHREDNTMKTTNKDIANQLLEIAKIHMAAVEFRGHLEELHSDSEDFIEVPVWGIEAALKAAYELGKASK